MTSSNNKDLFEIINQKKRADKLLLTLENVIMVLSLMILALSIVFSVYTQISDFAKFLIIALGIAVFAVSAFYATKAEQIAGYYECAKCRHRHVLPFKSILFSPHIGKTKYIKCPKCNKRSWNKKFLDEE